MPTRFLTLLLAIPPLASAAEADLLAAYGAFRNATLDPNRVAVVVRNR